MDIGTLTENLKRIDIREIILEVIKEFEVFFLDANLNQLRHGERMTGKKIGKYANSQYAAAKYSENPLAGFGNVDLILTGDFSRGIFIKFNGESLIFDSTGKSKDDGKDLLAEWGDDVLGVSAENIAKLVPDIAQIFIMKVNQRLAG